MGQFPSGAPGKFQLARLARVGVTGVPPGGMKCSVAEFMLDKGKLSQTWSNQPSGRRVLISLSLAKERVAMSKDPGVLKE